eukprot:TRINITY_DN79948_c0_g1_i1.p1 TRINITY_DN79948_c0_g1~~TRINITY_DN79948_c0_g1_i1.p1  ORF type:complete len:328 (+),score=29.08 TRINITY_DN79948_c0_g1_i1:357-1340(+)
MPSIQRVPSLLSTPIVHPGDTIELTPTKRYLPRLSVNCQVTQTGESDDQHKYSNKNKEPPLLSSSSCSLSDVLSVPSLLSETPSGGNTTNVQSSTCSNPLLCFQMSISPSLDVVQAKIRDESEAQIQCVLGYMGDAASWKSLCTKSGVQISRKTDKNGVDIVKGTIQFDKHGGITTKDIIDFLWWANPMDYNDTLETSYRLKTWDEGWPGLCVFYQSYKGVMGVVGREFILSGYRRVVSESHAVFLSKSIEWDRTDQMYSDKVLGDCFIGCLDCREINGNKIELSTVWQADLKGSLPEMIKKMISINSVSNLASVKKLYLARRQANK